MPDSDRRRLLLAYALVALGVYILLPTPDELVIHPTVAGLLYLIFRIPLEIGFILSFFAYRSVGAFAFVAALLIHRESWRKIKQTFSEFWKRRK